MGSRSCQVLSLLACLAVRLELAAAIQGLQGRVPAPEAAPATALAPDPGSAAQGAVVAGPAGLGGGLAAARRAAEAAEEPAETALFQAFVEVARNHSRAGPGGNASTPSLAAESALWSELRAVGLHSQQSAAFMRDLAASSANRTSDLVNEVALRSAVLLVGLRRLQQKEGIMPMGGAAHAYPHMHVAGWHPRPSASAWRPPPASEDDLAAPEAPVLGAIRIAMTVTGILVVALSAALHTNRKALALLVLGRAGKAGKARARALSLVDMAADAGVDGAAAAAVDGEVEDGKAGQARLTDWDATVATFSCIMGTGLLAMPYAFALAGLVAVPIVVFFVCCSAYTAHLMAWSLAETGHYSIGKLVEAAFGQRAKNATNVFLIVELWGYLLSSLICCSMNVAQLVDGLDSTSSVVISILSAYALSLVPSRTMTRINVLSNVFFVVCCLMFIITGLLLPNKAPASDVQYLKPHGLLSAAGILVFSPAAHSFYPALMGRMQEPKRFPRCVRRAYVAACAFYLGLAVSGYYLFGNAAQPSAVMNIGSDLSLVALPDLGWMNSLAAFGMAIKMLAMVVLVLHPLVSTFQGALAECAPETPLPLLTLGILAVSAAVAGRFAHAMATLLNLLGSVFCMNIAFVLPVLCYWALAKEPLSYFRRLVFVSLVLMGSSFAVLGLISAVQ